MCTLKTQIEELVAEHYNDFEIQNILKSRSVVVGMNIIRKVRDDMFAPLSWAYDDPRWDEQV